VYTQSDNRKKDSKTDRKMKKETYHSADSWQHRKIDYKAEDCIQDSYEDVQLGR
jgi:hypothetical protein